MVTYAEVKQLIDERRDSFDARKMACIINKDFVTKASLLMDALLSTAGETGWNYGELAVELDDTFEELRQQNIQFLGKDISPRVTQTMEYDNNGVPRVKNTPIKDYPIEYVLHNVEKSVKNKLTGAMTTVIGDKKKKVYVRKETYALYARTKKTNVIGIPELRSDKFYFYANGRYPYLSKITGIPVPVCQNPNNPGEYNALQIKMADTALIEKTRMPHDSYVMLIDDNIEGRLKVGISSLYQIVTTANNILAGFVRLDYDVVDNMPVVDKIVVYLRSAGFKQDYVSVADDIVAEINNVILKIINTIGIGVVNGLKMNVSTDLGTYAEFEKQLLEYQTKIDTAVENYHRRVGNRIKLSENFEKEQAALAAEKARIERERREQLAVQRAQEREERAQKLHAKKIQDLMEGIVTSVFQQGLNPDKKLFEQMKADFTPDENDENAMLFAEALNNLIDRA